jgi:hypothetical protein
MERSATFDPTGQYRYLLQRRWQARGATVTFIMLNPSQADAQRDDPTLRACLGFAQRWGYARLVVVNLFAYRTPYPRCLKTLADPIGPENDAYVLQAAAAAAQIILAWGNGGSLGHRDQAILRLLAPYPQNLFCLGLTQAGQPRHPLYLQRTLKPMRWLP